MWLERLFRWSTTLFNITWEWWWDQGLLVQTIELKVMTPTSVNMRLWQSLDLTWSWNVEDADRSRSSSILEIPCKFSSRPNPAPLQSPVRLSELCVVIRSSLIVGLVTQRLFFCFAFSQMTSDSWPSKSRRMKSLGKTRDNGGDGSLICPPGK